MANPEDIKISQAFINRRVIYNKNGFSMAIGTILDKPNLQLAMRWNGEDGKAGFPYAFKHPLWFVIPEDLTGLFLESLIDSEFLDEETAKHLLELKKSDEVYAQKN